jgi:ABC-type metal ion transport system substrate-binding protein
VNNTTNNDDIHISSFQHTEFIGDTTQAGPKYSMIELLTNGLVVLGVLESDWAADIEKKMGHNTG